MEYGKPLRANITPIPGLVIWDLLVHGDNRGWFKENWQRDKMMAAGLPDFGPVQNNISFNDAAGTTRGIHAEPWDKYVSVATGRIFGAWVDLREGPTFGLVFTAELDPSKAVFVPRGVGNAFQTIAPNTAYTYLVNDHYTPDAVYTSVNLADGALAIAWPIPLELAEISSKDRQHPPLAQILPIGRRKTLVIGANGQLGRALAAIYVGETCVEFVDVPEFDLTDPALATQRAWREYDTVINAAAYTAVDAAETREGRAAAWKVNVAALSTLARICTENGIVLVHASSDYVFDGSSDRPYREDDPVCPLGVYAQTKAAGDQIVATVPRHYILRTSWVIGDGKNFVRTMLSIARRGIDPRVVDDQYGRLTFTSELARAIVHLVSTEAPHGVYNLTSEGLITSWAEVAKRVFVLANQDPERVVAVSTADYFATTPGPVAPRPRLSALDLTKIKSTGYEPRDGIEGLTEYVRGEAQEHHRSGG